MDLTLLNGRFNTLTSRLPALHCHHHKGTIKDKILVLLDLVTIVVRMDTMPIDVHTNKQIKLQLKAQIKTPTAMPATLQLL
jgi:hypothetical protein